MGVTSVAMRGVVPVVARAPVLLDGAYMTKLYRGHY